MRYMVGIGQFAIYAEFVSCKINIWFLQNVFLKRDEELLSVTKLQITGQKTLTIVFKKKLRSYKPTCVVVKP